MKIRELVHFFVGEFHTGFVNLVLHFVGFTLLGYGLARENLTLVAASALIMESGHVYNYLTKRVKIYPLQLIPIQLIAFVLFYISMQFIFQVL